MATRKRILITAGPTWVAIDRVRVISNEASGETGFILANKFRKLGAKVTLLLGPGNFCRADQTGIQVIRFKYYSELAQLLDKELKNGKYAAVIHAAAVADYAPKEIIHRKVSSQRRSWKINLVPTKKLIKSLKIYQPDLFTVGFKFQPNADKDKLIAKGRELFESANLDLVVANSNKSRGYQAYILDGQNKYGPFLNKTKMAIYLSRLILSRA
ncbi:MAG: phosphopantothenoylcysteine decarboxylase [Candidatus Omnitrophota bacterium]|nr:phosphopantothenoylcysteine decarboxylase [Candidatus Omnitrophota bacterium]